MLLCNEVLQGHVRTDLCSKLPAAILFPPPQTKLNVRSQKWRDQPHHSALSWLAYYSAAQLKPQICSLKKIDEIHWRNGALDRHGDDSER